MLKIKVKYNHWFGGPFPYKRNPDWVYGRSWKWPWDKHVTFYFEQSRERILEVRDGRFHNEWLLRHELEHVYQRSRTKYFDLKYSLEFLCNLVMFRSFHEAAMNVSFEVEARQVEWEPLTFEQYKIF